MPTVVGSKEEASSLRVELTRVPVQDPDHKMWSRFVKCEGEELVVYAQPFVRKLLSDEERARREAEKVARREARQKRVAENQAKREAEAEARKQRKQERNSARIARLEAELEKARGGN